MSKIKSYRFIKLFFNPFIWALITFLLGLLFKRHPNLTETIFSRRLYPIISKLISLVSFQVDISLSDTLYISLVLGLIVAIVLTVFKVIKLKTFLLSLAKALAIIYTCFYFFWGFNYYRQPIKQRIELQHKQPNTNELLDVFAFVIEQTNTSYIDFSTFNAQDCDIAIESSYKELEDFLHIDYTALQRRVKYITFSDFFAKATILGYYGPFFNEVHINQHLSPWDIPIVTAHEKSHQLGITSEAEANLYAWMSCINSNNPYAKYSAWMFALDYFIYNTRNLPQRKVMIKGIKPNVVNDMIARDKHWIEWRNEKIDRITSKVNDAYLKSNNIEKGIKDYNDVVQLVVDLYYSKKRNQFFTDE